MSYYKFYIFFSQVASFITEIVNLFLIAILFSAGIAIVISDYNHSSFLGFAYIFSVVLLPTVITVLIFYFAYIKNKTPYMLINQPLVLLFNLMTIPASSILYLFLEKKICNSNINLCAKNLNSTLNSQFDNTIDEYHLYIYWLLSPIFILLILSTNYYYNLFKGIKNAQ